MTSAPERILCIAAHPDDDVIGCGGYLALRAQEGATIETTYVSSGQRGNREINPDLLGSMREQEACNASEILGITPQRLHFLGFMDGELSAKEEEITRSILGRLAVFCPNIVVIPHLQDGHPDHRAVARCTLTALAKGSFDDCRVMQYEIWTAMRSPNETIDIASVYEKKIAAMRAHQTQMNKMDYVSMIGKMASERGSKCSGGLGEAYDVKGQR